MDKQMLALLRKKQDEEFKRQQKFLGGIGVGANAAPIFSARQKIEEMYGQPRESSRLKHSKSFHGTTGNGRKDFPGTDMSFHGRHRNGNSIGHSGN